ncbi:methyl-accepting chemotaxis protein [Andreprevotia lacus DSM 23236]|jgi:methyl-accepting chemotaxis protein|uniref:Methyl-accepting chemotaxis protein n=1 Tax=Andreprevotia lacus DSM 23236 TaxID=1121001 RepID=A0A1W1XPV1_9NEIS|nr:methyl-accepting chemotaxis protein [Andreprevotia lacus]SMC25916.1 methyl-accepting chemotaxis protein [Andreprevotia lacus DSM 23236]
MRISAQLKIVSAVTVAALLGLGVWISTQISLLQNDYRRYHDSQQAQAAVAAMRSTMLIVSRADPLAPDTGERLNEAEQAVQKHAAGLLDNSDAGKALSAALNQHWQEYLKQFRSAVRISETSPQDALNIPEQIYKNELVPVLGALDTSSGAMQSEAREVTNAIGNRMLALLASTLVPLTLTALLIVASQLYFARKLKARLATMSAASEQLAQGDLTGRMVESDDEIGDLGRSLNRFLSRLTETLSQVSLAAQTTRSDAGDVTRLADAIHADAARQTAHLQDIGGASQTLQSAVNAVAEQAEQAAEVAAETRDAAGSATAAGRNSIVRLNALGSEFADAETALSTLTDAVQDIVRVAQGIEDIAGQTNLLALNAAIEAARAGEAGRGFAVVADEVRKLSVQTASSTRDIHHILDTTREKARQTLQAMQAASSRVGECLGDGEAIASSLGQIGADAQRVSELMDAIAVAVEEQGQASVAIHERLAGIGDGAQQSSRRSEEMLGDMRDLTETANQLDRQLAAFRFRR